MFNSNCPDRIISTGTASTSNRARGNIGQWQSKRQYADDALKFRAIRSWGGCNANDVLWLNKVFDIRRDEKAIEWVRKQADGYGTTLKAVSDSIMQEDMKGKSPTDNLKSD